MRIVLDETGAKLLRSLKLRSYGNERLEKERSFLTVWSDMKKIMGFEL
jgi:hypothetical protein